ncbi:MAG: hypothetical protein MZV70_11320 [Desulfobacterales bacterium]|nr:hypothetical protein [Desulfobacterales bacterium]
MINQVLEAPSFACTSSSTRWRPRSRPKGMQRRGKKTSKESRRRYYRKNLDVECDYLPLHAGK